MLAEAHPATHHSATAPPGRACMPVHACALYVVVRCDYCSSPHCSVFRRGNPGSNSSAFLTAASTCDFFVAGFSSVACRTPLYNASNVMRGAVLATLLVAVAAALPATLAADAATTDDDDEGLLVIGASFGRTGTMSTQLALNQLGFGPTHHMTEVLEHHSLMLLWGQIANEPDKVARQALLRRALDGYRSTVDFPACAYYEDLMEMYPNARLLLTTRDAAAWYKSARQTIFVIQEFHGAALLEPRTWTHWVFPGVALFRAVTPMGLLAGRMLAGAFRMFDNAETAADYEEVFRQWEAAVVEQAAAAQPPRRLLNFSVREGWEPLAAFLDVPAPEGAFPRVNGGDNFLEIFYVPALLGYAAAVLLAGLVWLVARRLCCRGGTAAAATQAQAAGKKTK